MTAFTLSIELGNAAMETGAEVALALHEVANRVASREPIAADYEAYYGTPVDIRDENGNTVGEWQVTA